jgi:putative FmdB family regulatory protein
VPIYEYRCEACGESFELFVRSSLNRTSPECPKCGSQRVKKAVSLFGVGGASKSHSAGASCSPGSV